MPNKENRESVQSESLFHKKENICARSERLEFNMNKENCFDDENDNEDEKEVMAALSDSDIDEMDDQLIRMNMNYANEESRPCC